MSKTAVANPAERAAPTSMVRRFAGFLNRLVSRSTSVVASTPAEVPGRVEVDQRKLNAFREQILGNDKPSLAEALGPPPRTSGITKPSRGAITHPEFLQSDLWYYPLDDAKRLVAVVRFDNGLAADVSFVRSPAHRAVEPARA